ncbi:putative membrane protein [Prescottella equi 103S]|uniref:Membrane protein n=1 Tax=Rhodococcus hoagii (strain 103S) TaxID=685727 RepID=A0A3S5Y3F6_RHOH1|nr:putative membrane protein [Prescottella equi 103S]
MLARVASPLAVALATYEKFVVPAFFTGSIAATLLPLSMLVLLRPVKAWPGLSPFSSSLIVPVLNMPDVAVALPDQAAIVPTAPSPRTMPRDRTARVRVQATALIRPPIRAGPCVSWLRDIVLPYFASVVAVTRPVRSTCALRIEDRVTADTARSFFGFLDA